MPLVSKTFDQLLDFTRTTAATFVGSNGLIQNTPASVNLLTQTQQFDNAAWAVGATTVTANTTVAPDGTSTADKVVATTADVRHVKNQLITVTSGVSYTLSFYVKAAEYSKVYFADAQSGKYACSFDLAAGTAGTPTGAYTGKSASITNAGNGWYRCTLSFTANATESSRPSVIGYPNTGATLDNFGAQYIGDDTSGIFAWGAQLEAVPAANLVLGSERWTNSGVIGMSATIVANGSGWDVISTGTSIVGIRLNTTSFGTSTYQTTVSWSGNVNGRSIVVLVGGGFVTLGTSTTGSATVFVTSTNASNSIQMYAATATVGETFTFTVSSVKEITGTVGMPTTYTRNNGGRFPPRFDYDPVTLAPKGILIEEQRTNLLVRSEQLDNAAWGKNSTTITADATTSPDGTVDADKVVEAAATAAHSITQSTTGAATTAYTVSFFVKAAERTQCYVWFFGASTGNRVQVGFNLSTAASFSLQNVGAFTGGAATITAFGNGWYRCTVSATTGAGETSIGVVIGSLDGVAVPGSPSYTGDGTSGIFIYGAQLEAGAFATSYIPTVASQVTRAPDVTSIVAPNFAPWYNQSEGTFVVEADSIGYTASDMVFSLTDSDSANSISQFSVGPTSSRFTVRVGGVDQAVLNVTVSASAVYKIASAYATNDFASVSNGGTVQTDTSGNIPTVDRIGIGNRLGLLRLNGHIRSIQYFPVRLSNAQLQALTA
jgi:hypothetical protein